MLKLYIGNKNYSPWAMRPWVLMKQAGIPFEEVMVRMDAFTPDSGFKQQLARVTPAGKVPALVDGDLAVWDSLAIAEYLAERFPEHALWPRDVAARARARSAVAEMHSGFAALRGACGMNIEARLPEVGAIVWRDRADVRVDVARIAAIWREALVASGGPLLFRDFSIADAYYAPTVLRLETYALPVPDDVRPYMERVRNLPAVQAWIAGALAEHDFLAHEEPYRSTRDGR